MCLKLAKRLIDDKSIGRRPHEPKSLGSLSASVKG